MKNTPDEIEPFYHGTKADLPVGSLIEPGFTSNYGSQRKSNFVYFSATLDASIWGAELALGDQKERIYLVQPNGDYEDDPNLTDKKFPGNATKSYRSRNALKVVGEISEWQSHSREQLQAMKAHLQRLKEQGIEAVDE